MLLRPKLPDAALVPTTHAITSATPAERHHAPETCSCHHAPAHSASRPVAPFVGLGAGVSLPRSSSAWC
jgi:hypothetical protein